MYIYIHLTDMNALVLSPSFDSFVSSIQVAEAAAATITADALASKELWERCNLSSLRR